MVNEIVIEVVLLFEIYDYELMEAQNVYQALRSILAIRVLMTFGVNL